MLVVQGEGGAVLRGPRTNGVVVSAAEMCGILEVHILGNPPTLYKNLTSGQTEIVKNPIFLLSESTFKPSFYHVVTRIPPDVILSSKD